MTPTALLEHLDSLGIELWLEKETLRFRAPEGALTDDLKVQIKQSRSEIMRLLHDRSSAGARAVRDPEGAYAPFPLTDVQGSYLVGRTGAFSDGGIGCHGYAEFDVDPRVLGQDPASALRSAWARVVDCHPMLRAIVHAEGWQQVVPELEVPLQVQPATQRSAVRERLRNRIHPVTTGAVTDATALEPLIEVIATIGDGPEDVVLHLSVDLLLTDFLGLNVLLTDLGAAMRGDPIAPPSLTYRDYLASVTAYAGTPAGRAERERAERFWSERAARMPDPITLSSEVTHPTAAAPTTTEPVRFTRRSHHLDAPARRRLEEAARGAGVTTTSLLMAVLGRVLHRHGGPEKGLVAMTLLDRLPVADDVDRIVGDATSTVLVEVDARLDMGLAELAAATQRASFEALDHRALSGVEIARMIAKARGIERLNAPVVVTSTIGTASADLSRTDAVLRPRPGEGLSQTPQVLLDVQLSAEPASGGMTIDWDSRDGGFSSSVLTAAFADFTTVLDTIVATGIPAGDPLARRSPAPIARTGRLDAPGARTTLHDPILDRCREDPHAPAVIDGDEVYSRGHLAAAAAAAAERLRAAGIAPGHRVVVNLPPGIAQVAVELGALIAGASYVPVEPDWPEARRAAVLAAVRGEGPAVLVEADTDVTRAVTQALAAPADHAIQPTAPVSGDAEAYVIFTSGSTGRPKGVMVTHRQARTTLADLENRLGLGAEDAVLAVSRHSFDLSVFNTFGILGAGGRLVIPSSGTTADPQSWAAALERHQVSVWNSVPAQLTLLLDHLQADSTTSPLPLRHTLVSGDWVPVDQPAELWRHAPGCCFWSLGGATEAAIWSVLHEIREPLPSTARSVPYGMAMDDQAIWVLNEADEPACPGQVGDLVIGGDGVATGYLGDPERTAEVFFTHPGSGERCYRTGDRGRLLADGRIEFLGRLDGQVKINGHRIELGEIESVLAAGPGVAHAVAAVDRSEMGRPGSGTLLAAVVPETSAEHARQRALRTCQVTDAMHAADQEFTAQVDTAALRELAALIEESATDRMAAQIARGDGGTVPELINTLHAEQHSELVGRWLTLLAERGWLTVTDQRIRMRSAVDPQADAARWQRIRELDQQIGYGTQQLDYLVSSLTQLPGLLSGEVDPLALLFPEGRTEVAVAAYGENLFGRWINGVLAAGIAERARQARDSGRTLRVLEIGGGVGGTTAPVLAALANVLGPELNGLEYLFTDVSPFFFEELRERYPRLRTALLDINDSDTAGILPGSVDVVLSANVLHNARDIPATLEWLSSLLSPGGALAMIDSTAVNAALMASMEFKEGLDHFTDLRTRTGRPFLDLANWLRVLENSPFELAGCFPEAEGHPMRIGHQHVFWATTGNQRADLDPEQLRDHLAETLPRYMVPQAIAVLDHLPLTSNGKVDRARVTRSMHQVQHTAADETAAQALSPQQQQVAAIWQEILGLEGQQLAPTSDFFDLGGDSLLLARCIGRLRRGIPGAEAVTWDDALRQIVADPSIAGCTRALVGTDTSAGSGAQPSGDPLVPLLPADGIEDELLVLVHDGSGGLDPYRDLIAALGRISPRPRVVGLRRTPGDGYLKTPPEELLDHLGDRYADAITALGARRVRLFGYCMGGLIAAGLATRLAETQIDVAACTVASSYRIPFAVEDELLLDHSLAKLLHRDPADAGIGVDEHALGRALTEVRRTSPSLIAAGSIRDVAEPELAAAWDRAPRDSAERLRLLAESDPQGAWTPEALAGMKAVFRQSMAAVAAWDAPAYLGDIRFLRQRGELHFLPTLREDMTAFWSDFCLGDLEIQDVDGTHFDCLSGERADAVCAELARDWGRA